MQTLVHSLFGRLAILSLGLVLVGALVLPGSAYVQGAAGLAAATAALLVCAAGGVMGLGLASLCRGPQMALYQLLLGMIPRSGVPLAACIVAATADLPIVAGGFIYYVLAFYLVTLILETMLLVLGEQQTAEAEAG